MTIIKKLSSTIFLLQIIALTKAQQPIDVSEQTLKVKALGEEVIYIGFAEGDQLVLNFEELNEKELKELEIIELPSSSKFLDFKTKKIQNKVLSVPHTGIYKFRFSNSALSGRICKFKIQRIPISHNTRNFNTDVYWKTLYDTVYTPRQEKYLVKSDTVVINVLEQTSPVSSQNALNGNKNINMVEFTLPERTAFWSYHIGTGKVGKETFEADNKKFIGQAIKLTSISGYGPMAALAIYSVNMFRNAGSDNVKYWFISDWESVLAFSAGRTFMQYKLGDVTSEASQMKFPLTGKVYIGLLNDNVMDAIEVNINITAIQINQTWDTRVVNQMSINASQVAYLKD